VGVARGYDKGRGLFSPILASFNTSDLDVS